MKALSLNQPWASLIVAGNKSLETRSWSTKHRGDVAIHASKGITRAGQELVELDDPAFRIMLERAGLTDLKTAPRGAVLGYAKLVGVYPAESMSGLSDLDLLLGDFSPGRFVWQFAYPEIFPVPIPAKGALGLWEWSS